MRRLRAYEHVLDEAKTPGYFVDPRLQDGVVRAGGHAAGGINDIHGAANGYLQAAEQSNCKRLVAEARTAECRGDG